MSLPEQNAWDALRPVMAIAGLDPRRVENVVGPGHPDVNYCGGDMELKVLTEWPKRPTTCVRLPELSGEQVGWLLQRQQAGGLAWLMVKVEDTSEWFLFDARGALSVHNGLTQAQWRTFAAWQRKFLGGGRDELAAVLRGKA